MLQRHQIPYKRSKRISGGCPDILPLHISLFCFVLFLAEKQQHQQNLTELQVFIKFKEFIFQKAFCPLADINYPFPSPLESFNSGSLCINAYCSRTKIRQKMWNVLSQLHFYEDSAELCMYHFCKARSPPGTLHAIML